MTTHRLGPWVAAAAVAICLVAVALLGLWQYMGATAERLHPNVQQVPSTRRDTPRPALADAVERGRQAVRVALSEQNLPGMSVAVGLDGDLVWAEGFGWADLEARTAVTPDTRFRIGSASTALTSAAVGLLLERRRLALEDEIQVHVPAFPRKPWPVTVRHLMAHTAGVRSDGGDEEPLLAMHCGRPVDALHAFADASLLFEPGTGFRRSSYGWMLLSAAVESAAGEPFLRFVRKQIVEPLGMDDTEADEPGAPAPDQATSYFPRFAADPRYGYHDLRPIDLSCAAGAGAFVSSPSDLVRFGMAIAGGTLLRPETVDVLLAPQRTAAGEDTGYGLGWDLETLTLAGQPMRVAGHDGDLMGGRVASLLLHRERRLVVAVTSNIAYADTFAVAARVADAFATRLAH